MRGFLKISQNKLPKRSFRARLPRNFTEEARKINVSCQASWKFHRRSFQNERFARCFRQNKLPKRAFRMILPTIFTEKASKMIVSCEASSKFHRKQASKTSFSCEASSKFHRTMLPKRTFRAMLPTISTENFHFATINRPTEPYERVHPAKAKCAYRYNGVPSKISKCTFRYSVVRKMYESSARRPGQPAAYTKITISPQFRTSDQHKVTRGLHRPLHFTTLLDIR